MFLPGLGWCCQWWRVDHFADLSGEVFGRRAAEAGGEDGLAVAAAYPDEPDVPGGAAAAAGRAVVDLDGQRRPPVGVAVAVRRFAAGRGAVEPWPSSRVARHRVGAAGPRAAVFVP